MTETTTLTEPRSKVRIHPADLLMNLIVSLLAPMFLGVTDGDVDLARMAAAETINAYQTSNIANLIAIAQIVACGLAALGSLSLSMADDLTLSMTLRLRGNANALNRSAEQHRRTLRENHRADLTPQPNEVAIFTDPPALSQNEGIVEVPANAAEMPEPIAGTQPNDATPLTAPTSIAAPAPAARSTPIATPAPAALPIHVAPPPAAVVSAVAVAELTDQQIQTMWDAAMTELAGELTADLDKLSPADREEAESRFAVLHACANELISGSTTPQPTPSEPDTDIPPNTV